MDNIGNLEFSTYGNNWICTIDADKLDIELSKLKIGKNAVAFYQDEIEKYLKRIKDFVKTGDNKIDSFELYWGQLENLEEKDWYIITGEFFKK
jgi:hypothetical protein